MTTFSAPQLMRLAAAIGDTANAVDAIFADGEVNFADLVRVPAVIAVLREYVGIDFKALLPEVKTISPEDLTALAAKFSGVLNLQNDTVEAQVEQGFAILVQVIGVRQVFQDIIKNKKV